MKIFALPLSVLLCACGGAATGSETRSASVTMPADTAPPKPGIAPAAPPKDSFVTAPAIPSYQYLTGKFDPAKHPDFVPVAAKYTDGDPYLLHQDTYAAFERMHAAALADGVELIMVSATRNFARQKQIWEAKWNGQRKIENGKQANVAYPAPTDRARAILRYSSMPGTSRHHWGTDIDLNALNNEFFDDGKGKKIHAWLTRNGPKFGFCQPYTPKGDARPNGYEEERWHWSYLPVATQLTNYATTALEDADISGFDGAEAAVGIGVLANYVLGINRECLETRN
jgi:LAS superfamily LD-carboxypeptidase LdcB